MSRMEVQTLDLVGHVIGNRFRLIKREGAGAKGTTYEARDSHLGGAKVCIKVVDPARDPNWQKEAVRAARVRFTEYIASIIDHGTDVVRVNDQEQQIGWLEWEFVEGETLEELFSRSLNLPATEIVRLAQQLCEAINAMRHAGLEHGDLHERNIKIYDRPTYTIINTGAKRIKVLDFGLSRTLRGEKYTTDVVSLGKILRRCWTINSQYEGKLVLHEKNFLQYLPPLIKRIEDLDPQAREFHPRQIADETQRILVNARRIPNGLIAEDASLTDLFEYLQAEQIPEHTPLLFDLFSDLLPWYTETRGFATLLISGPRGCGKSILLKNMRLQTKLASPRGREQLLRDDYVGLYIQCHTMFSLPFSTAKLDDTRDTANRLLHYVNLLFLAEALHSLNLAALLGVFQIGPNAKRAIFEFTKGLLQAEPVIFEGTDLLDTSRSLVEREAKLVQQLIRDQEPLRVRSTADFVISLASLLRDQIDLLADKKIYFILDDYSDPNAPYQLQKSFNRVLRIRDPKLCFKLSAEKFSITMIDLDGKVLEPHHDYRYLDLGAKYLTSALSQRAGEQFISDVIKKRVENMKEPEIERSLGDILGHRKFPYKNIGASLALEEHRAKVLYGGLEVVCALCSGDVRTLLELCRDIFLAAKAHGCDLNGEGPIPLEIQDKAIRRFARNYLGELKGIEELGQEIFEIAEAFGTLSRKYLYEYGPVTKVDEDRYYEVIRIGIDGDESLSREAKERYEATLRYSVFLDSGERPPRRDVLTKSLIFRKIYTPAFGISYRNRECLRLSVKQFEKLLLAPKRFLEAGTTFLEERRQRELQPPLFED